MSFLLPFCLQNYLKRGCKKIANATVLIDGKNLAGDVVIDDVENVKIVKDRGQVSKIFPCKAFFPCAVSINLLIDCM